MSIKKLLLASLGFNVFLLGVEVYVLRAHLGDTGYLPPLVVCIPAADQAVDALDDATSFSRTSLAFDYGRDQRQHALHAVANSARCRRPKPGAWSASSSCGTA